MRQGGLVGWVVFVFRFIFFVVLIAWASSFVIEVAVVFGTKGN